MLTSFGASCPCCRSALSSSSSPSSATTPTPTLSPTLGPLSCQTCTPTLVTPSSLRKGLKVSNDGTHSRLAPKSLNSIWSAAADGDLDRLRLLVQTRHVPPDILDTYGVSPVHKGCLDNHARVVQFLLEHGANPDHNGCGATALHRATSWKAYECMEVLLRGGADINAVDTSFQDNRTALHKACDVGFHRGIALLLKWGGNTSLRDATQLTPLQVAIQQGHLNCVRLLWGRNNNTERDDQDLLALAIHRGQIEVVELFFGHEQGIAHERHVAQCTRNNLARRQEKDRLRLIDQQASRNARVVAGGRGAATVPKEVGTGAAEEEEKDREKKKKKLMQQPRLQKIPSLLTVTSSRRRNKK